MKIVTLTRITIDRDEDIKKFNELMEDKDWVIYESFNNLVTFEKISELIIT